MKKVVISGYYGFDNFGDEEVLEILVQALQELDVDITVLSANPERTAQQNEVNAFQSFNIVDVVHQIFVSDILISGGGSLLQDKTSKRSFFYYMFVLCVAFCFKKRVIIFSQGIEPLKDKNLEKILKWVMKKVDYISVRDKKSTNYLVKMGLRPKEFADSVWSLKGRKPRKKDKVVIQLRNAAEFDEEKVAILAKAVANKFEGKKIEVLPLQDSLDLDICNKFVEKLVGFGLSANVLQGLENKDVIKTIASASYVVAMRYHACLLAIKYGIPLVAISYDDKVKNLALEFKLPYLETRTFFRGSVKKALDNIDAKSPDTSLLDEKSQKSQEGIDDIIRFINDLEIIE